MLDFLRENWAAILTTIGGIIVWLSERSKRLSEDKVSFNNVIEGIQGMYDKFVVNYDAQYERLSSEVMELKVGREEVLANLNKVLDEQSKDKVKIRELEEKIKDYEDKIHTYEKKISDYENQVSSLTIELNKYKTRK